jgi:hypothetical protein
LAVLAGTQVMDDLGKGFFPAAAFPANQHGHVGRRHLDSYLNGIIEQRGIANNAKPLLNALYIRVIQCFY